MGSAPRHHHFVPQFYLSGFSVANSADGDLYVCDQQQVKSWKSSPKQAAHQRDFYAIDAGPDGDAMAVEKALSVLESRWSIIVRDVIQQRTIPDGESFGDLMMFIALMAVRVKRIRKVLSDFTDRVSKAEIFAICSTEEGRAHFRNFLVEQGFTVSDEEFEDLISYGRSGCFSVDFEKTWHIQQIIQMASYLGPILSLRKWVLWPVEDTAPDLICSDSPVAPTWVVPTAGSPAFGTPNTIVSIPLNRRLALVSLLEVQLPAKLLDREAVAALNSATGMYATQLYSSNPDFAWSMRNNSVGYWKDLEAALRNQPEK